MSCFANSFTIAVPVRAAEERELGYSTASGHSAAESPRSSTQKQSSTYIIAPSCCYQGEHVCYWILTTDNQTALDKLATRHPTS
jgi:hypothetical protein